MAQHPGITILITDHVIANGGRLSVWSDPETGEIYIQAISGNGDVHGYGYGYTLEQAADAMVWQQPPTF